MEFLKLVRRRSFLSEAVYMVLNIGLALALLVVIRYTGSIPLAIGLVLISKWRVLAVRARYWVANIRSNLIDFIVSIGVVLNLYMINDANIQDDNKLALMVILSVLYVGWLLFLKPRSKRSYMAAQAGIAVLLGVEVLYTLSFNWPVSIVVLGMWLIGFAAARHVLSTYDDETHALFVSLAFGVAFAEIGWVAYHVTIGLHLPFIQTLQFPEVAIIAVLLSFVAYKAYDSFYHHQKIRINDVILPILFTVSLMVVLWFVLPSIQCDKATVLLCLQNL
ncbi:MAG: hypothetical protein ABIP50_04075 [Candidatus Saccharimonadales bacterium]